MRVQCKNGECPQSQDMRPIAAHLSEGQMTFECPTCEEREKYFVEGLKDRSPHQLFPNTDCPSCYDIGHPGRPIWTGTHHRVQGYDTYVSHTVQCMDCGTKWFEEKIIKDFNSKRILRGNGVELEVKEVIDKPKGAMERIKDAVA